MDAEQTDHRVSRLGDLIILPVAARRVDGRRSDGISRWDIQDGRVSTEGRVVPLRAEFVLRRVFSAASYATGVGRRSATVCAGMVRGLALSA